MTAIVVQLPGCEKSYTEAATKAATKAATDSPKGVAGRRRKREEAMSAAQQQQQSNHNNVGAAPYGVSAPEWKKLRAAL